MNKFCEFSKGCSFFLALNKETRDKVLEVLVAVNLKYFWNTYSQKIMNALTCCKYLHCTIWKTFLDQESRCDLISNKTFHIREFGPKMLLLCTQLCVTYVKQTTQNLKTILFFFKTVIMDMIIDQYRWVGHATTKTHRRYAKKNYTIVSPRRQNDNATTKQHATNV